MSLAGESLEPGRIPASFKAMYSGRRTGVLRFRHDGTSCGVSFVGGHVTHAEAGRGQLRLAERMAARGLLSREDRKRGTERALREGRRVGETLVSLGVIDADTLRQAMALHAKEIVAELLAWTEGDITFEPRDRNGGPYEQPLALSTAQLVVEASRVITDPDVFAAGLARDTRIAIAREPLLRMQRLRWSPADRFVLDAISGGSRTVEEIVAKVPLPASESERVISTLLWIGVLEPAQAEPERPPFEREVPLRSEVLGFFKQLGSRDHLRVLRLSADPTDSQVNAAYARLASRFHPDAQHDAELEDLGEVLEAIFLRLEAAHQALMSKPSRPKASPPLVDMTTLELAPLDAVAAETQVRHARDLIAQGAYFEGIALLRELLIRAQDPATRTRARLQIALAYLDSPQTAARARTELERVSAETPEDLQVRVLLARTYALLGHDSKARATLKAVLEMAPDHREAREALETLERA